MYFDLTHLFLCKQLGQIDKNVCKITVYDHELSFYYSISYLLYQVTIKWDSYEFTGRIDKDRAEFLIDLIDRSTFRYF